MSSALRHLRYFRHLKARTIVGRIAHGLKAKVGARFPEMLPRLAIDSYALAAPSVHAFSSHWASAGDRFKHAAEIENGVFHTKAARAEFGSLEAMDWTPRFRDQPELANWAYDFASFSYGPKLVRDQGARGAATVARLLRVLDQKHPIAGRRLHFVWTPISVALRIMGLTATASLALRADPAPSEEDLDTIRDHIALCERYLSIFAERYLGYNHAAFGLVALCVAHVALRGPKGAEALASETLACLESQVLDDGLQAERTATYHLHVLNLAIGLSALRILKTDEDDRLRRLINKMTGALDVLVHPDGEIAIFNDAAMADATAPAAAGWTPHAPRARKASLPQAGYAKLSGPSATVIFDAGRMGPEDVIGHGHGDFLAVEVSVGKDRLIVDPGVRSYSAGQERDLTRSSQLHNGPTYEGIEPAEFFGAWRVGWRGGARLTADADMPRYVPLEAAGVADGYDRAGGRTARYVGLDPATGAITLLDAWRLFPGGRPVLRWLVSDLWSCRQIDEQNVWLTHAPSAQTILIKSSHFHLNDISPNVWHPKGPMEPNDAHLITMVPSNDIDTNRTILSNWIAIIPQPHYSDAFEFPSASPLALETFLNTGRIDLKSEHRDAR